MREYILAQKERMKICVVLETICLRGTSPIFMEKTCVVSLVLLGILILINLSMANKL